MASRRSPHSHSGFAARRAAQRKEALARANVWRARRSELRKLLKQGVVEPIALIEGRYEEHEEVVRRMPVEVLLLSVPLIGKVRCQEVLREMQLKPTVRVGALSYESRRKLARYVKEVTEVVVEL